MQVKLTYIYIYIIISCNHTYNHIIYVLHRITCSYWPTSSSGRAGLPQRCEHAQVQHEEPPPISISTVHCGVFDSSRRLDSH